ncbi:LAS seventeen-binding protein 3 [Seminavis robusta]|uniref:LAS seventeen-binding protein 3 n=1 Tax=Seminavis robusta TaxID=568900 RepID=A0A9N8H104_9STRA|nr:LAS seventeen-binding protein 3 [Seminavis robusta]|eukprot:Sro30_g019950.1 LAS seventeen-binding protein 3 (1283) ;mRNA; r:162003-165851
MSFFTRFTKEASNAFHDMYGNVCLGDDAGKSARLTLVLKPHANPTSSKAAKLNLGMTFLEVNGRAYVQSVIPGSQAARAGVMPQDAIQFATVFKEEWVQEEHDQQSLSEESLLDATELATQHALQAEASGVRITYDGLRKVLAEAIDPTQSAFVSPPTHKDKTPWHHGPPIPSTVNICVPQSDADGFVYNDSNRPSSPFRVDLPRPVIFVFRRTRQRKSLHHMGMLLPGFRLDDECDFASSLVKRLAPTADMETPIPDTWEELVHDGTDWLLGSGSMLPPKMKALQANGPIREEGEHSIPLDSFERERATKLADLRSKMAAEAMQVDRTDDVEAATIRGMIQKAVGLAFVRASKVVLGVSVHGGSGIVISRLSDGTWSAPSAIGTWGLGLGLQFGLEVAEYIFILQTQDSLDHFRSGGSFTIGGNIGAAVAGMGREAYGAASAGGGCGGGEVIKDDEYNDNDSNEHEKKSNVGIAPIVAYAKSQGLYIGVSLEGSRIFARNDINSRTYKFTCGRDVSAYDVLSGKVPTPPEAEDLYAALHSVEFTHEMSCLPRPPEVLRKDSPNAWFYDRSTLGDGAPIKQDPFNFLSTLSKKNAEACETFETQFKKFMYGGVSVQRLLPNTESRTGRTCRERRTMWLMLPEVGSLRLGFVSKLSDGESCVSNKSSTMRARQNDSNRHSMTEGDLVTVESEEVTLDSALYTDKDGASTIGQIRTGNVQLSQKHSVALTDLTLLSHDPLVPIKFNPDDQTEHLRVISLQDVSGTSLLFLANNFREAELLMCGLKLLLERETARLGVRGGLPISALGGRVLDGAMSPTAARGFRDTPSSSTTSGGRRRKGSRQMSGYASSEVEEFDDSGGEEGSQNPSKYLPEGRKSWGRVPGRSYMRGQAAAMKGSQKSGTNESGVPQYVHGQLLVRDVAKKVRLPLPLPLCRVLLLDSTSPVIARWEKDRGDMNFDHTLWTFPPATPRELERHASEHSLIATGSMCGAHRTSAFDRMRNGSWVRLSETQIVDADDSEKLAITVSERMPRRGFSIKIRILLRAIKDNACEATVFAEIRPVGKDMSNQAAVHRAFLLVFNEIASRYGEEAGGLMAGFLSVIDTMGNDGKPTMDGAEKGRHFSNNSSSGSEEKKSDTPTSKQSRKSNSKNSGLVSFEDMLKTGRTSPELINTERPSTPSLQREIPEPDQSKRLAAKSKPAPHANEFVPVPELEDELLAPQEPVLIEVKPLPKIRLSLMPAPREEDEENDSSSFSPPTQKSRRRKSSSKRKPSSSWRKSGRHKNKA